MGKPQVQISEVTAEDAQSVERAIEAFRRSTNHGVDSFVDLLRNDFRAGCISTEAIERLSKWANSDYSFARAVEPARQVVHLLFGSPLVRLIDEEGHRVPSYVELVEAWGQRIE
jgi:hypothetical protein